MYRTTASFACAFVGNAVRLTIAFFRLALNDSARALSQQTPVPPTEDRRPSFFSFRRYSYDMYWLPRSELNRNRFNSDYAEVVVKPRSRGLAVCGQGCWLTPRLNVRNYRRL